MTLDYIPSSHVNPPDRIDSLYNRHLAHHQPQQEQDHVPVPIGDAAAASAAAAYTTSATKTTENFRKRSNNPHAASRRHHEPHSDYDSSDIDLFDSKSSKFSLRKEEAKRASRKKDWLIVLALTFWAMYIRLYKLSQPPSVV